MNLFRTILQTQSQCTGQLRRTLIVCIIVGARSRFVGTITTGTDWRHGKHEPPCNHQMMFQLTLEITTSSNNIIVYLINIYTINLFPLIFANTSYFPIAHSASARMGSAIYLNETQSILCAKSTKNGNKFRVTPWAWARIDGQGDWAKTCWEPGVTIGEK